MVNGFSTDDPLRTLAEFDYFVDVDCMQLATLGGDRYIEIYNETLKYRGFASYVELREDHAGRAVSTSDGLTFYTDQSLSDPLGQMPGGIQADVLVQDGASTKLRIGHEPCTLEVWVSSDLLLMGALPSDVNVPRHSLAISLPQSDILSNGYAFTAPSMDAAHTDINTYGSYELLAQVGDFLLLRSESNADHVRFIPKDWTILLSSDSTASFYDSAYLALTLGQDTPVTIWPDPTSRQTILLYKGVQVNAVRTDGHYLTKDYQVIPSNATGDYTLGYLQIADETAQADQPLRVGLLTPSDQTDTGHTLAFDGGWTNELGYGTRLILMGETDRSYLVRTPMGTCGLLNKMDVTLSEMTLPQEDYALLSYGIATVLQDTDYYQRPYSSSYNMGKLQAGSMVTLLSNLGDWWCILYEESTYYIPEAALSITPQVALKNEPPMPVYQGIYSHFRDEPFAVTAMETPGLFGTDTDVWLLLQHEEQMYLSHRQLQGDTWVEVSRTDSMFSRAVRSVSAISGDAQQFTLELYAADNNVKTTLAFASHEDGWQLASVHLSELSYDYSPAKLLYDRLFTPVDGGLDVTADGKTQFVALGEAISTAVSGIDALALQTLCEQAYTQLQ